MPGTRRHGPSGQALAQPAIGRSTNTRRGGARGRRAAKHLLADEPTGNLDSTNGEAVMELLRELHRGGATICHGHPRPALCAAADRIVHLFDGLIVEEEAGANRREIEDARGN